jgi:uncharacterized membrane protein YgcG
MTCFGRLLVVPWILFAQATWTMDAVPAITAVQPQGIEAVVEVRDRSDVFSIGAKRRARKALQGTRRGYRTPIVIETVRSLDGAWIADVAQRRARMVGADRLYILVAGNERDVGVVGARHGPVRRLTDQQRETILRSFLAPLQAGKPDEAIDHGVRAIGEMLDAAAIKSELGVRDALISITMVLASLALLFTSRIWSWWQGRSEQRCRIAAVPGDDNPAVRARRGYVALH